MQIGFHLPLADLRGFMQIETGRLGRPHWPDGRKNVEFIRSFGGIKGRRNGGVPGAVGEHVFCRARGVHFSKTPALATGPDRIADRTRTPQCRFRRIFFDGMAGGRFDLAIDLPMPAGRYPESVAATSELLTSFLDTPVDIYFPLEAKAFIERPLALSGDDLARGYLVASTATSSAALPSQNDWVVPGAPFLVVELGPGERLKLPAKARAVRAASEPGFRVHRFSHEHPKLGRSFDVWVLARDAACDVERAAALRRSLTRRRSDTDCLSLVLDRLGDGQIACEPGSKEAATLAAYLEKTSQFLLPTRGAQPTAEEEQDIADARIAAVAGEIEARQERVRKAMAQLEAQRIGGEALKDLSRAINLSKIELTEIHPEGARYDRITRPSVDVGSMSRSLAELNALIDGVASTKPQRAEVLVEVMRKFEREATAQTPRLTRLTNFGRVLANSVGARSPASLPIKRAVTEITQAARARIEPRRPAPPPIPSPSRPPPEERPLFAWLHLSDVHIGHTNIAHQWDQALVLDALLRDVAHATSNGTPRPDAILVTGDIAFSATAEQYGKAKVWLLELAARLGLTAANVFLVPGNHDVDRSVDKARGGVARLVDRLREGREDLDTILADPEDTKLLLSRMQPYLSFAADFPSVQAPSPLFWSHTLLAGEKLPVRLIGMNTALLAANDLDKGKLRLGKRALAETLTGLPDNELVLLLSHHPFREGWLADQREAERWIKGRHGRIHLFGHVHEADTEDSHGGSGTTLLRLAAGAVHGDKLPPGVPAGHGYSFAAVVPAENGTLRLRVWPRRWSEQKKQFTLDVDNTSERPYAEHPIHGLCVS